jgi:hypothetical protein
MLADSAPIVFVRSCRDTKQSGSVYPFAPTLYSCLPNRRWEGPGNWLDARLNRM